MAGALRLGSRIALNVLLHKPLGFRVPTQPSTYGLTLHDPERRERAEAILRAFFLGVETALRRPAELERVAGDVAPVYWPFFWEGAAMGQEGAYRLPFFRGTPLDEAAVRAEDRFLILRVVGVGFMMGFLRPRDVAAVSRTARRFGNLGPLVHDGLGFQAGMFRWRGDVGSTARLLDRFSGAERESALHGLGRSLWFRFMDDPDAGFAAIRAAPDSATDVMGGFGLAAAFTLPDHLSVAYRLLDGLAGGEARAFGKGIRVALFVRDRDQREWLAAELGALPGELAARARRDLELARRVDAETRDLPDYIPRFHAGCGDA